jgi:hypothetical protein
MVNSNSNSGSGSGAGNNGNGSERGNKGTNSGVAIGVGVGVGLFVSTLAVLAFLFFFRRRRNHLHQNPIALTSVSELSGDPGAHSDDKWAGPRHELYAPVSGEYFNKVRVHSGPPVELPSLGLENGGRSERDSRNTVLIESLDEEHATQTTSTLKRGSTDKFGR